MEQFTKAIKQCLDTNNWYGALYLSLTMPDICGNISYPNSKTRERYELWFNKYLSKFYKYFNRVSQTEVVFLTASDCYALRCSALHEGVDNIKVKDVIARFSFSTLSSHCNLFNNVLCLNVTHFCEDVIKAMEEWDKENENDVLTKTKIQNLLTIHEEPYSPLQGVWYG